MSLTDKLSIIVVGYGRWGRNHAATLKEIPNARLVAVVDIDERASREAAENLQVKAYSNVDEVLEKETFDAATVATPPYTHADIAVKLIEAQKHVYVEKPFGFSAYDALRIKEAAEEAGVTVMPGFSQRYIPVFKAFAENVKAFGRPRLVTAIRESKGWFWSGPRIGIIPEQGIHGLDLALHVAGSPPSEVAAFIVERKPRVDEMAEIIVRHKSGTITEVKCLFGAPRWNDSASAICEEGELIADRIGRSLTIKDKEGKRDSRIIFKDEGNFLKPALKDFIDSVLRGEEPPIKLDEGVRNWRVCDAAYKASQKSLVVKL
ncbi:gfo/Idh/MocA family oxidoreductase [Candidatus Bathyarchaeota archaeon]|nr:MAG: hypothetical protein B6U84_02110 [Candidatus Bathyarchaeota archaeon ex4484_40]RJS79736.1 MAG: gfo/Idh/MocA family oxidoreductase [Candidatus Bathyarchaeota archaeon]RLG98485.1 MAG: hypothetical protein DRO29_00815 [Candidatus Bathyarchaeota archaeon]